MELTEMKRNIDEKLLRLDIQYFAEGEEEDKEGDGKDDSENKENEGSEGESEKDTDGNPDKAEGDSKENKTFTQEDIDRIVKERLDREKRKREEVIQKERDEAERKRLEEQGEYKELADKLQAELDAIKGDALKAKKEALLVKEGYSEEQIGVVAKLLEGETDEELQASLDEVKVAISPKRNYADPSAGNTKKNDPKPTDLTDKGRSAVRRLREKGKIRKIR